MTDSLTSLIVVHESDATWSDVLEHLSHLSRRHLLSDFMVVMISGQISSGDVPIKLVTEHVVADDYLFDYLARSAETKTLVIAGIVTSNIETGAQQQLDQAILDLNSSLVRMAQSMRRINCRVSIPSDQEQFAGAPFFSSESDVNVVVLPRDQARNQAIARPVAREQHSTFVKHAGTEIASLLGLWTFMKNTPLENVGRGHQGFDGYEVVFATSRVKGLLAPPLPIGMLVDDGGELPVPAGFTPLERPSQWSIRYAQSIYPDSLRFEKPIRPNFGIDKRLWSITKMYLRELGSVVVRLPLTFWRGLQSDVNAIAGSAMNEALGGEDGWVNVVWDTMSSGEQAHFLTQSEVEKILKEIEDRAERPVLAVVPHSIWASMTEQVFGISDGSDAAEDIRHHLTQSTFLMLDKESMAPCADSLETISELALGHDGSWNPIHIDVSPEDEVKPSLIQEDDLSENIGGSGSDAQFANGDEVEETTSQFDDGVVEPLKVERIGRSTTNDVVGAITQEFVRNFEVASESSVQLLSEIQNLPASFAGRDLGKISRSVLIGIGSAIALLTVALGSMTPARSFFSFDWMARETAAQLWLMFSTVFVVFAVITGITGGNRTWQGRAMMAALVSSAIVAFEFIFFSPIYNNINKIDWLANSSIPAILVFLATLFLCLLSATRNLASSDAARKKLGKIVLLVSWTYAVAGLTSALAGKDSVLQRAQSSIRGRFFISANVVGWALLLTGCLIVAVLRVREKNRVGKAGHDFRHACRELEVCVDARTRLDIATAQWLGIAAVISRIIWYPLGRKIADLQPADEDLTRDEQILKFDLANIKLRESGTSHLLAQLRQRFVRPGWLYRQYQFASNQYIEQTAFDSGNQPEKHDPLACASTPTVDEVLAGYQRGDRWGFAHKFFSGDFDELLLSSAVQERVPDLYKSLVKDVRMHEVTESQNDFATAFQFLSDLVPTSRRQIPPGLTNKLFTANQKESSMQNYVWWPEEDLGPLPNDEVYEVKPVTRVKARSYKDSEMMMAATVQLSYGFHRDDLTGATRDESISPSEGHDW